MAERGFDSLEVREDVSVIKFEVVDNGHFGQVMNELAAFIEKSGVVFVAFDDKPFAVGEAGALAKIGWNAADQVAWVEAIVLENPGEQRRRGSFAMGPSHD